MTSSSFIKDNMLIDPSMQKDIIRRAVDGHFGDNPKQAVQPLGTVKTPDGREVPVHLRHAADAVLLDDLGHVVVITRKHNPGAGLKTADCVTARVETPVPVQASLRAVRERYAGLI